MSQKRFIILLILKKSSLPSINCYISMSWNSTLIMSYLFHWNNLWISTSSSTPWKFWKINMITPARNKLCMIPVADAKCKRMVTELMMNANRHFCGGGWQGLKPNDPWGLRRAPFKPVFCGQIFQHIMNF